MPVFGSSVDGDSDMFCISVTLHLISADAGKHFSTYMTCDAKCHDNSLVDVSVAAAAKDDRLISFSFVYVCLHHWHCTHCYPELL